MHCLLDLRLYLVYHLLSYCYIFGGKFVIQMSMKFHNLFRSIILNIKLQIMKLDAWNFIDVWQFFYYNTATIQTRGKLIFV